MYEQGAPNMERVEKNAATVEEECNYLAAAATAVVKHEQDKLNQEREDKKTPKSCWVNQWI